MRSGGGFAARRAGALFLLEAEAGELLLEAGDPPGAIHELLLAAGPGRVRLRVDVETQRVTLLAPGGAGGELGSVRHDHLDGVVFGMSIGLHGVSSRPRGRFLVSQRVPLSRKG